MSLKELLSKVVFSLIFTQQCLCQALPDRHSTNLSDGWLSCVTSANPNTARGTGHWIRYDLGETYALTSSKIWNFNTPQRINSYNNESWSLAPLQGKLEDGMKDIIIDISLNGTLWKEWGRFTIPKAPGSSFYEGVFGPDFNGQLARYVLITGISNYGGTCYGLGEIKFNGTAATLSSTTDLLADATLSISPNPFSDQSVLIMDNFPTGEYRISLKNISGLEIRTTSYNVQANTERFTITGHDLPAGPYIITVSRKDTAKSVQLEIVR